MDELYLIYVHKIGYNHANKYFYDFIFSDTLDNIDGEGWDSYPASSNPEVPFDNLIVQVGKVESDFELHVVQDNEQFSMYDALDNIISLAWENIDGLDEYPEERLVFPFGMEIKKVIDLLYARDVVMEYKIKIENE
jgi:hypothetical protein|tara:strand:- start:11756 stop:12163 length:408 start_codon:yes stop_codon:yes gene_type:complete